MLLSFYYERLKQRYASARGSLNWSTKLTERSQSPQSDPGDIECFPQFSLLPAEIRQQIWEEALPGPRMIMPRLLPAGKRGWSFNPLVKREEPVTWSSSTGLPALLHVSYEARTVALRRYSLALGLHEEPPRIYIDFETDFVSFSTETMGEQCDELWSATPDAEKVCKVEYLGQFWVKKGDEWVEMAEPPWTQPVEIPSRASSRRATVSSYRTSSSCGSRTDLASNYS